MSSTAAKKLISVDEVIASMPSRFNPEECKDIKATYQWELSKPDRFFYINVDHGTYERFDGKAEKPNVTVICETKTYLKLVNGEIKDIIAILTKKLMVKGSMSLGQKLSKIFA